MAALLTTAKAWRAARTKLRALTALLPESARAELESIERDFQDQLRQGEHLRVRQAERIVGLLYDRLEELEGQPAGFIGKRVNAVIRDLVVDLELLMLPQRERDFELLGVSRHDDLATAKSRYRALARRWHPDLQGGDTGQMEALNRAWAHVSRAVRRS